jgi:uncharacterized RDD family membrane protein YckC
MIILAGKNKNIPQRYYANVIDYGIYFIMIAFCIFTMGEPNNDNGYTLKGVKALIMPLIWIIYFPLCESVFRQTIGKKIFNLYVVDARGESASIVQTFLRRCLDIFEFMFLGAPSIISINASEKNLRIGDRIADTRVITTSAICRFCGTELELSSKEVINNVFMCPKCSEIN